MTIEKAPEQAFIAPITVQPGSKEMIDHMVTEIHSPETLLDSPGFSENKNQASTELTMPISS